ncbi:hypothetical protein OGAPHI_001289 [Ogataea philodendri]|uniref:Phosphoribulokinase/uridine kinase domain-containing protein n=1 Tax=Ogataea philodendri TaxID=1378263 RepID=A0A9P8T8Y0_9ASCO|nr:uncharacterized protein OGAPHI_001289 [Ogataea philodendri]KAH3670773.1 hypothetical protein OGAPHI_001289 [Ogataea philodendri]
MSVLNQSFKYLEPIVKRWNFAKPLIVGLEGPQGSGKTYVTTELVDLLSARFNHLNIVRFSIDDFYLTYNEQLEVNAKNEGNILLQGRGLPGTHDLKLLLECFEQIESGNSNVAIPFYDKSLKNGKGDRAPISQWTQTSGRKIDIVLFEGWLNGYLAYDNDQDLVSRWLEIQKAYKPKFDNLKIEHIIKLNSDLTQYLSIWKKFDQFIYITTCDITNVYTWRLQQEHALIKQKGMGMSDTEVEQFIDRYMPAYHLFYSKLPEMTKYVESCINFDIGLDRKIAKQSHY